MIVRLGGAGPDFQRSCNILVFLQLYYLWRRAKGITHEVQFNQYGQPVGDFASEMQSYIGLVTREHVKITFKTWRQVPEDVKELIWLSVNSSFKVPAKWKTGCLESASTKWRTWKYRLHKTYIEPNKDNPIKLYEPPSESGIPQSDWNQFVISRLSDDFKKLSEEQKERSSQNEYPHRVSRKGYAKFAAELARNGELKGDEEDDRCIIWKRARSGKEGDPENKKQEMAFENIDNLLRAKSEGSFNSKGGYEDLLTCAFTKPEHSGRVRGMGAYVTPTTYFKVPRERRKKTDEKSLQELEDAKKRIAEQDRCVGKIRYSYTSSRQSHL